MVVFENPGILDVPNAMIFGISAKQDDTAIGYFGTGLKYAVAVCLREGLSVSIVSNGNNYVFGTKSIVFRGKIFDAVTLNGNELSFTTELGKNWQLWMAYREFYCNALDESGHVHQNPAHITTNNSTYVRVKGNAFDEVHYSRDTFILNTEPLAETSKLDIHPKRSNALFYKKIKVHESIKPFAYTYNFKCNVDLTEDRTAAKPYSMEWDMRSAICKLHDEGLLEAIFTVGPNYKEHDMDFANEYDVTDEFMTVARRLNKNFAANLNPSIRRLVNKWSKDDWTVDLFTPTTQQQKVVDKAVAFLKRAGYDVDKYPILFKKHLGDRILAMMHEKTIYISERAISQGTKQLASTLYEEYVHAETSLEDETYELQTYLFDRVISLHEELLGEVL